MKALDAELPKFRICPKSQDFLSLNLLINFIQYGSIEFNTSTKNIRFFDKVLSSVAYRKCG